MKHQEISVEKQNLPAKGHLDPSSQKRLSAALWNAFSVAELRVLMGLPSSTVRRTIEARVQKLGTPLTRAHCEEVMRNLGVILPRAKMSADDVKRCLNGYFGLLANAGLTNEMLSQAAERIVMAPRNGEPRWFPDPGQIADACRDDLKHRAAALASLQAGLVALETPPVAELEDHAQVTAEQMAKLTEKFRVTPRNERVPGARLPPISRPDTDASELRVHVGLDL